MNNLLIKLRSNQRKGSKPRCHWLTHGSPEEVSVRLSKLIEPWGKVTADDRWMPEGFDQLDEAELHKATRLLPQSDCEHIREWWFKIVRGHQTAPSFDIASTCMVGDHKAILLIEAKAYDKELINEERGKPLPKDSSEGERTNHDHIGKVIGWANGPLTASTDRIWSLSRDSRYQMSNRFASAYKLTELGFSVILIYLGFLNAEEMRVGNKKTFDEHNEWESLVLSHSKSLFPEEGWSKRWTVHSQSFIPLIRSVEIPYDHPLENYEVYE